MDMPERIGPYPITAVLARGGVSTVYRACDAATQRPLALKAIRKSLVDHDARAAEGVERLRRQARAAAALRHPCIAAVQAVGEDAQHVYAAMELAGGRTLRDRLDSGQRFDERECASLMAQLLDALEGAHAASVWHGDVNPSKILVAGNGRIKLIDFNIGPVDVALATQGYVAPEQYFGAALDHRIDLFAAGAVFYELLAGQAPFRGKPDAVMHDVCWHDPAAPSQVDPQHRWPQYDAVVARALDKSPARRWAGAGAFRSALLAVCTAPLDEAMSDTTIVSAVVAPAPAPVPMRAAVAVAVAAAAATPLVPSAAAPLRPAPAHAPAPAALPSRWSPAVLAGVEHELARWVGPVAKVLVYRAAQRESALEPLVAALLPAIERAQDREAFSYAVMRHRARPEHSAQTAPAAPAPCAATGPQPSRDELDRVTRLLRGHVGPLAGVVVRRAAAAGASREAFLREVARVFDTEAQRDQFLRALQH
jgi:eukaryotic-like serine/threonine-protein kinase